MPGLAVNADPSIQPPNPLLRLLFFRKSVIDTVGAPHNEKPVSDLMCGARGELTEVTVDQELANSERLLFAGFRADLHSSPLTQDDGMGFWSGKAAAGEQQRADEYAKWAHSVAQLYDLAPKELKFGREAAFEVPARSLLEY